jgi:hypothetical protein
LGTINSSLTLGGWLWGLIGNDHNQGILAKWNKNDSFLNVPCPWRAFGQRFALK